MTGMVSPWSRGVIRPPWKRRARRPLTQGRLAEGAASRGHRTLGPVALRSIPTYMGLAGPEAGIDVGRVLGEVGGLGMCSSGDERTV